MAGSVNKVILIGNLGKDPEVKFFEEGRGFAKFPLATSESYNDKSGERVTQTEWHNVTVWRQGLVGITEKYLKKGDKVYIEGRLKTRSWEDENKVTKYITEIIVENLTMLGSNPNDQSSKPAVQSQPKVETKNEFANTDNDDDDLPF